MKKILLLSIFSAICIFSFSQSTVLLRGDTIRVYKQGGTATLKVDSIIMLTKYRAGASTDSIVTWDAVSRTLKMRDGSSFGGGSVDSVVLVDGPIYDTLKYYIDGVGTDITPVVPYNFSTLADWDLLRYNLSNAAFENYKSTYIDSSTSTIKVLVRDTVTGEQYHTNWSGLGDSLLYYNFQTSQYDTVPQGGENFIVSPEFDDYDDISVYREGLFQYVSTFDGITISNDTLFFFPNLSDSERVNIRIVKDRPTRQLTFPPLPGIYFTDNFTGTNDTYINSRVTTTGGLTWDISAGSSVGTKLYSPPDAIRAEAQSLLASRYTVDVGVTNIDLRATIGTQIQASSPLFFLILAFEDDNNFIQVNMVSGAISETVASTPTSLYAGSGTSSTGDIIRVNLNGTSISVYRNGSILTTVSVSGSNTGTKHGTYFFNDGGAGGSEITFIEGREAQ